MRVTIRDVAEAAGVSAMAVSAVMNGSTGTVKVSAEKAAHIRKIAAELRYQPNRLASSLRSRRTGMVAVVFQHFDHLGEEKPYYPQLLNGVMAALFPADLTLCLCPQLIRGEDSSPISDGRFDGVLWCRPDFTASSLQGIQTSNVPVVLMHAPPGAVPGVPTFCADNEGAMRTAVNHLAELGHKKVAFVVDPINTHTVEGELRRDAFLSAALRSGMNADVLVWDAPFDEVKDCSEFTALVCFSDTVAGGVISACARHGVSVPHDLSIIGFDSSSFCEGTKPRLTSLNQPVERMAYAATLHLISLITANDKVAAPSPVVSSIYDCGLDVRESTGAPRHLRRGPDQN